MKFSLLIIFLITCFSSFTQVVNIEKKRFSSNDKKLQGNIDLSVNFIKSTKNIIQGKNVVKLQYFKERTTYLFFNDITIMQVDTQSYLNSGFQHLRYNYDFKNKCLIAEAFTQIQYNKIQKLQRRFLWGTGTRYRIHNKPKLKLYAGTSFMYEFELLEDNQSSDKIRLNLYLSTNFEIKENLSFGHITYYQPALNYFNDFRLSSETNMKIKISDKLIYKVAFSFSYDSEPPENIQNLFYNFNNGISYIF